MIYPNAGYWPRDEDLRAMRAGEPVRRPEFEVLMWRWIEHFRPVPIERRSEHAEHQR